LENAVVTAQRDWARRLEAAPLETLQHPLLVKGDKDGGDGTTAATRVHARLVHLPPSCCQTSLGTVQAQDVGKIVQVSGTVVRASPVQMYESARTFQCRGSQGCQRIVRVHADLEQRHNALVTPTRCPLLGNDNGVRCRGTNLQVVDGGSVHTDYQEVKIQEAAARLGVGHIPRSLLIKLQHDLVDQVQPGDEVIVVGSLLAQWHQPNVQPDVECHVGIAMTAHSIRVVAEKNSSAWKNAGTGGGHGVGELDKFRKEFDTYWSEPSHQKQPVAARDFICKAVCPKLYGLQVIKLALLLTLTGGVSSDAYPTSSADSSTESASTSKPAQTDAPEPFQTITNEASHPSSRSATYFGGDTAPASVPPKKQEQAVHTRRRDQSHLLLVGDPGTGKSQFLRFAAALCPRSVLTTGVGTTSAGLTCAAVREGSGKEFSLEAGALVLADKGVCCIDEFGCIQEKDRTTIHEAMEQQTLSVAKAGIVCKLNCRATIIAVMNPRDCLYDNHASLSYNTGLGTPLLSRFDLIFKLVDTSDAERDSKVTTYLLNRAIQGAGFDVADAGDDANLEEPWTMEKLRAYIAVVKERFLPVISDEAATLLERHYEKCRSSQSNTIPVTVRFLESLIRLSQAHARLMWRPTVTLEDAAAIIQVMERSAFAYGGFDAVMNDADVSMYCDPMTIDFAPDPDADFLCFLYRILERYGMLGYLSDDSQRQALALLGNATVHSTSWQEVEQGQPWPNDVVQSVAGSARWSNDAMASATQDHYGRYHFSSSSSQTHPHKKPRT
jgi:DNA replicative helicase MCM subunit Mcm2 (Cdc46/Mcm family)